MKKTILSGMRPTGKLHLGHLVGALENWVSLQQEYQNYHLIADYHALTTDLETGELYRNSIDMLIDWLAAGIDPTKPTRQPRSARRSHKSMHRRVLSARVTSGRPRRRNTRLSAAVDSLAGAVISMPIGAPPRLKSITKPGSAFAVR